MIYILRMHLAHVLYEMARLETDPHLRRRLRRIAAPIVPKRIAR